MPLVSLSTNQRSKDWLHALAARQRHARGPRGQPSRPLTSNVEDAGRKRRASASRTFTFCNAALNLRLSARVDRLMLTWRRVDTFKNVNKPTFVGLPPMKSRNCWRLWMAISAVVCRSIGDGCQIRRIMPVESQRLFAWFAIEKIKSGKPRHVPLTDEGNAFFKSIVIGRDCEALMFTCNGHEWKKSEQAKPMNEACTRPLV